MNLDKFLNPRSIAVIGASNKRYKIGSQIFYNLKNNTYRGHLYPVNLDEATVLGFPAYSSIDKIKKPVDLVLIAIPMEFVALEVKKCAKAQIKNIVIISAGFSEAGAKGKLAENELRVLAEKYKLNILGPNCLGFINNYLGLNATFAKGHVALKKNQVAFISQSGAIGSAVLDWVSDKNISFNYFVSLGNKLGISENDVLKYLLDNHQQFKDLKAIVLYLESFQNGREFMALVSRLSQYWPVAVLKAGQTVLGQSASSSHTGSLASSPVAVTCGLKRSGAIILSGMEELFNFLEATQLTIKKADSDLYIISNAGGPLVLSADYLSAHDISTGQWSAPNLKKFKKVLPASANFKNPLDILGDAPAKRYADVLAESLSSKKINNLLVLLTPQTATEVLETANIIVKLAREYKQKNILTAFVGGQSVARAKKVLGSAGIPVFDFPETALLAFKQLADYNQGRHYLLPYHLRPVKKTASPKGKLKDYLVSLELLKKYGFNVLKTREVDDFRKLVYPAVFKIVGPGVVHKTDESAIFVGVRSLLEAEKIFKSHKLLKNKKNYLVWQEMANSQSLELILGAKNDPDFGPLLIIGWGGVYAEVLNDVVLSTADLDEAGALRLLEKLKVGKILSGYRGGVYNVKAVVRAIMNLARLITEHPEISEIDINPLFVSSKDAKVADIRIINN